MASTKIIITREYLDRSVSECLRLPINHAKVAQCVEGIIEINGFTSFPVFYEIELTAKPGTTEIELDGLY